MAGLLLDEALFAHFLDGLVDQLFDEGLRFLRVGGRADAGPEQLVLWNAVDQRLDDQRRIGSLAALGVDARPAVVVIAPERRVRRCDPYGRGVGDPRVLAHRPQDDDPVDCGALEPGTRALRRRHLLGRRHAVGRDGLQTAGGEHARERLLAGHAKVLIAAHYERCDFLSGEADAGGLRRFPGRSELWIGRGEGDPQREGDREGRPADVRPGHGRTVTAAESWNCTSDSADSFKCSVPDAAMTAPAPAPASAPMAAPLPPPAMPPIAAPSPALPPIFRVVFLPSPSPFDSTWAVTMSYWLPPNASVFAFSATASAPFILPAFSTLVT